MGAYYIQVNIAAKEDISLKHNKVSGNEEELNNLVINTDYQVGYDYLASMYVTNGETINLNYRSFFESLPESSYYSKYNALVEEYKGFMRGKRNFNGIYNDENKLVYVQTKSKELNGGFSEETSFEIDVLNKKTNDSTSFNIPLKESEGWSDVERVQMVGNQLKIIKREYDDNGSSHLLIYSVDMENEQLLNDETIYSAHPYKGEGDWSDFSILGESFVNDSNVLIKIDNFIGDYDQAKWEATESERSNSELMVYNVEKGTSQIVQLSKQLNPYIDYSYVKNTTLYIPSQLEDRLEVEQYDLVNEEWKNPIVFDLSDKKKTIDEPFIKLMDGKIYTIYPGNKEYRMYIGNLETGMSLYEGEIDIQGKIEDKEKGALLVFDIYN